MKENIPEEGLEHFDEYLQNYSRNENHPLVLYYIYAYERKTYALQDLRV